MLKCAKICKILMGNIKKEPKLSNQENITTIYGPMKAGKSTKLISFIRESKMRNEKICTIKPIIDNRYEKEGKNSEIVTHDNLREEAMKVGLELNIELSEFPDSIFIDEAQFFDYEALIMFCNKYSSRGVKIYMSFLDTDYKQDEWSVTKILKQTENKIKLVANCTLCEEKNAEYTISKMKMKERIVIGSDGYEPRCFNCISK